MRRIFRGEPGAGTTPVNLADWRDPRVGWGWCCPIGRMCPLPRGRPGSMRRDHRELLARRPGSPVLRWRPDVRDGRLRRYSQDGKASDLRLAGARGTGPNAVPRYC